MSNQDLSPEIRALLKRFKGCRYSLTKIDPEMATAWLQAGPDLANLGHTATEKLDEKKVVYGRAMRSRIWALNGDAIVFDEDGKLIDGVARLLACIDSGTEFASIVFFGVPREANLTIGSHLKRTTSDILDINGEENPHVISHAWPLIIAYLNSEDRYAYVKPTKVPVTPTEMIELTDRYPDIRRSAQFAKDCGAARVLSGGVAVATHFITSLEDVDKADAFIRIVGDPALDPASAPATLSHRVTNLKRTGQTFRFALTAKAWNRYRTGARIGASGLIYAGQFEGNRHGTEAFPAFQGVPVESRIDLTGFTGKESPHRKHHPEKVIDAAGAPELDIIYVTPAMAAEFLKVNGPVGSKGNRSIRRAHFSKIGRDLRDGRWIFNAQPIKFGRSGRLIDGQHRCQAAVESGVGFITFVVRNLDDSVFSTFDAGESKSLSKHLKRANVVNATTLGASINLLHRITTNSAETATPGEGFELLQQHPDMAQFVTKMGVKSIRQFLPSSVAGVLFYLFAKKAPAEAERFFHELATGENIPSGDPMGRLRNILMLPMHKSPHPLPEQKAKITIQAWNARRKGIVLRIQPTHEGYQDIL